MAQEPTRPALDESGRAGGFGNIARGHDGPMAYKVGYFVGSLSSTSINRELSKALIRLAPDDLEFSEIAIDKRPLYSQDYDAAFPSEAQALKQAISEADAILFVSPEYNRSIPGALKNAIDWASRPWGQNSFDNMPAAVIGASVGQIGTAMAQQSLRGVLSFCNARQMTTPEAYIQYSPDVFTGDGEVTNDSTREFLTSYMAEFRTYIIRVLTVIPRPA
jgi:chromate reductase, NAD(P)H dehydrogenase (quinone)